MQNIGLSHPSQRLPLCLCVEFLLISTLIGFTTVAYRYWIDCEIEINLKIISQIALITVLSQICIYYTNLYDFRISYHYHTVLKKITQSIVISTIIIIVLFYFIPYLSMDKYFFIFNMISIWSALLVWRYWLKRIYIHQTVRIRVAIIGTDEKAKCIASELLDNHMLGYDFRGFIGESDEIVGVSPSESVLPRHDASALAIHE
jgi:FlaA1/EpsC-like NDP-sugar epimerase